MKETADFKVYTKGAGSGELKVTVKGPSESGGDPFFLGGGGAGERDLGRVLGGLGVPRCGWGTWTQPVPPYSRGYWGHWGNVGMLWGFGGESGVSGGPRGLGVTP